MRKRSWLRKFSKIGSILAIFIPIVGYGLSNLYLVSPKGRSFLSGKITALTGLEASLEGASWSPWNGITLYGIRVEQPTPLQEQITSPLLLVESVRLFPVWSALKDRRLSIKSIEIRRPELTFPVELLSQLPSLEKLPQIALNDPTISESATQTQSSPIAVPPGGSEGTSPTDGESETPTAASTPRPKIESVSEQSLLTTWVNFSDASIKVLSTFTKKPLYEASEIRGSVPIGGKSVNSMIQIGPVKCLGNLLSEKLEIPIRSQGTILATDTIKTNFAGIDCQFGASVSFARGLPFQITSIIPAQKDKIIELPAASEIQAEAIAGEGRFQGLMKSPGTWQGQWVVQAFGISGQYQTNTMQFDHGRVFVVFRDGALRCLDARMIGDSTSLLGNATLLKDGRMAAIARIVSPPENLVAISKPLRPDHSAPHLTLLNTPQRAALDLQLFGRLGNLFYKPDPKSDAISLKLISPD